MTAPWYLKVGEEVYPFKDFTYSIRSGPQPDDALVVEWVLETPLCSLPPDIDETGMTVHCKFNVEGGNEPQDKEMVLSKCTLQVQHPRLLKGVAKKLSLEGIEQDG